MSVGQRGRTVQVLLEQLIRVARGEAAAGHAEAVLSGAKKGVGSVGADRAALFRFVLLADPRLELAERVAAHRGAAGQLGCRGVAVVGESIGGQLVDVEVVGVCGPVASRQNALHPGLLTIAICIVLVRRHRQRLDLVHPMEKVLLDVVICPFGDGPATIGRCTYVALCEFVIMLQTWRRDSWELHWAALIGRTSHQII